MGWLETTMQANCAILRLKRNLILIDFSESKHKKKWLIFVTAAWSILMMCGLVIILSQPGPSDFIPSLDLGQGFDGNAVNFERTKIPEDAFGDSSWVWEAVAAGMLTFQHTRIRDLE